jgi:hypothetical protein
MTSVEKDGDCTYLGTEAPQYAIITYTWGRFAADRGCPALPIDGVTWDIPPVQETCFSVASFQHVIGEIGEEYTWLWLDVACIDQEDEEVKTSEISRQVGIFYGATAAYAWLHSLDSDALGRALSYLSEVADYKRHTHDAAKADILRFYELELEHISQALRPIFEDPWFTSLWTLQEAILRRDAILLASDGNDISDDGPSAPDYGYCRRIKSLNDCCQVISQNVQSVAARLPTGARKELAEDIIFSIEKAGFNFNDATNPNVQYSWARHRQTKDPKDRIYAIIGIYDVVLRGSFQPLPPSQVSREDLELAFGLALNHANPWLAQCFVHLKRPKLGRSFCISQDSVVPPQFARYTVPVMIDMELISSIYSPEPGLVLARGKACTLGTLWRFWLKMRAKGSVIFSEQYPYDLNIAYDQLVADLVDKTFGQQIARPIVEWVEPNLEDTANDFRVTEYILNMYGEEDLYVLQMGYNSEISVNYKADPSNFLRLRVQQPESLNFPEIHNEDGGTITIDDQEFLHTARAEVGGVLDISLQNFLPEMTRKVFGLMLLRIGADSWQRIGICRWTSDIEDDVEMVDFQGNML